MLSCWPGLTNGDGDLASAERKALRFASAQGEAKLKMTLENATTSTANAFWKSDADKSKLKDIDYVDRLINDLTFKDAEAKKGSGDFYRFTG